MAMTAPFKTIAYLSVLLLFQAAALRVLLAGRTDRAAAFHLNLKILGSIACSLARGTRLSGTDQFPSFFLCLRQICRGDIRAIHIELRRRGKAALTLRLQRCRQTGVVTLDCALRNKRGKEVARRFGLGLRLGANAFGYLGAVLKMRTRED